MPKKQKSDVVEISVPKFLVPVVAIVVLGLIAYGAFSMLKDKDVENGDGGDVAQEQTFSDPAIVEASVKLDLDSIAYAGDLEDAKYVIVEFSDYKCPYCSMHADQTFPQIKENYLDDGVVYIFQEVAIMSADSMPLSALGRCVFEHEGQNEYLNYRKKAYTTTFADETELLGAMEIDSSEVKNCFDNSDYVSTIENHSGLSQQAGVQGVPGFIVGELLEDGLVEGYLIPGAYPYAMFEEVLGVLMN